MGRLVDGQWVSGDLDTPDGRFVRPDQPFRNWITADGSAGPSGRGGFKAEAGRYHLYVAYACPWAQRTLIFRALKGLERMIDVSIVHWLMLDDGWTFAPDDEGIVGDKLFDARFLYEIYQRAVPRLNAKVTVPVLWDKEQQTIVNNESSEIIRMFNQAFDGLGATPGDYYPASLRPTIDEINRRVYDTLNNGVYKCGFASTQAAYDEAVYPLFATLDWLEDMLGRSPYLCGAGITEADWRLLTTLLRFDAIYYGHFKCNLRRLVDYPNLWAYARRLFHWPGIAATFNLTHAKRHYYGSHRRLNPSGIVPAGPLIDFG